MTEQQRERLAQWEACYPDYISLDELLEKRAGILLDDPLPSAIQDQIRPIREHLQTHPRKLERDMPLALKKAMKYAAD